LEIRDRADTGDGIREIMDEVGDGRGVLYPARLPSFHREAAPDRLHDLVRWFWIPRWRIAPGRASRQRLLPFPASNLVVQPAGVTLAGPTTGASHRDLRGTGWAVGALLRPAGIVGLGVDPSGIRDTEVSFGAPDLRRAVAAAMGDADVPLREAEEATARRLAVDAFGAWLAGHVDAGDDDARLANAMEDLIAADRSIVRVERVAERLGVSVRRVQRLARCCIGVPPLVVIRRYRLQEAAQRLRDDPSATVARVAAELGYADQAHLAADFRTVLGLTPSGYRGSA